MKYCKECGAKLRNEADFCFRCGAPCQDVVDPVLYMDRMTAYRREQKREEKSGPGAFRLILTLLLLLAFGAVMFYLWYSPGRRSFQCAVDGQTEEAKRLYAEKVAGNPAEAFILRMLVPRGAAYLVEAYRDEKLSYAEAEERLRTLAGIEAPLNSAARAAETVENLCKSDEAFRLAKKYEEAGDLRSAMLAYRMVDETDARHEEAASMADRLLEEYRSGVLTSIGVPETEAEYARAVEALEAALAVLPGDRALTDARSSLKQSFAARMKAQTVPLVTEYIASGYYSQAIALTKRALVYSPEDTDLKSLAASAVTNYESFIRSQVPIYLANGDRAGAEAFLDRVGQDLPGDPVVEDMRRQVEQS